MVVTAYRFFVDDGRACEGYQVLRQGVNVETATVGIMAGEYKEPASGSSCCAGRVTEPI